MIKKLLTAGMTLALLWGCYVAYGHGFELVVQQFRTYRSKEKGGFDIHPSKNKQRAIALARESFGPKHWSVTSDQPFTYYSPERGFWMYSLDVKEIQEEDGVRYDGKRLKMKPFAVIFESKDGRKHQMVTGNLATLDLSQPISLGSKQGNDAMKVTHALIEGNVCIRDDHGTPMDLSDDMNIGPMTHLVFDEGKQQFTTDSQFVMRDAELTAIGEGMVLQMRKKDPNEVAAGQSSGFEGAEYLILNKSVRVTVRDVGNSGVLPGSGPARKSREGAAGITVAAGKKDQAGATKAPSPLVIMSEGMMRIDFAEAAIPVLVGPPEPPAPTKVRFERNVVALMIHPGGDPDQLNCDTLKLTLIPAEKPPEPKPSRSPVEVAARSDAQAHPDREILGAIVGVLALVDPGAGSSSSEGSGPFGNLTLQRAHAIGHAVWLQLREQESKVLCNELIHERRAPYQPDRTYFRGDATRQVWLEKIDREPVEADDAKSAKAVDGSPARRPKKGKISGVTHVVTVDVTLFDMGGGSMDLSDIVARGPGKMEARPDLKEPVEQIAIWQDELTVQNILGPDSQLLQKKVTLTGSRPSFVDTGKKTSIDSAQAIYVWLKPKPSTKAKETSPAHAPDGDAARAPVTGQDAFAVASTPAGDAKAANQGKNDAGMGLGGGGLQIEHLQAFVDAHFLAPGKKMEAREVLDTPFVDPEPTPLVASTASSDGADGPVASAEAPPGDEPAKTEDQAPATVAAQDAQQKPPADPTTTAVADRIWAKVALKPGSGLEPGSSRRNARTSAKKKGTTGNAATAVAAGSADSQASGSEESDPDILEAWLWGNVSLHQESPPDKPENPDGTKAKPKTQDVTGEAVYLDNYRGKGKMRARVYDHDPNGPLRPKPWPLACVATDEKTVRSTLIRTDQKADKFWCDGPGELTQWTDRALFTDKKAEPKAGAEGRTPDANDPGALAAGSPGGGTRIRTTGVTTRVASAPKEAAPASKPKTRGGRPISDKDLLTITWTKRMEFTGRATDPTTKEPAGKAEFFGFPNAQMEDAQLKCDERMIVYTDREMPLGELGSISNGPKKPGGEEADSDGEVKEETPVDIALIYCFGRSMAVTRKLDPDVWVVLEQHIIFAEHRLDYDRRTGEFVVPGAGEFYKYERKDESENATDGKGKTGESRKGPETVAGRPRTGRSTAGGRTVTPTSGRTATGASGAAGGDRTTTSAGSRSPRGSGAGGADQASPLATPPVSRKIPPLILTQVFFTKGLQGQFGSSQEGNATQDRTALLFGDIQLRHAQVNSVREAFDFDQPLTEDGFYLTSQILRLIQEPKPPGAPESTRPRSFLKAWDNVLVNKGQSLVIASDVGTYDSGTDTLYAYGEGDRGVKMVEQYAVGQPGSPMHGKAVQFNVKSGAAQFTESDMVQLFDKRTGSRPTRVAPPEPGTKKPKRRSNPFMVPNNNLERRGFTGQ